MRYLFDASSVYRTALAADTAKLIRRYTCSLAWYELGNILVTETRVRKALDETEQQHLLQFVSRALSLMAFVGLNGEESKVVAVAMKYGLSFYDASYVYAAKKAAAVLVTEDGKLAKKVKGYVDVINAETVE